MDETVQAIAVLKNIERQEGAQNRTIVCFYITWQGFWKKKNYKLSKVLVYGYIWVYSCGLINMLKSFLTERTRSSAL